MYLVQWMLPQSLDIISSDVTLDNVGVFNSPEIVHAG